MAKNSIRDYSATASQNTDIDSIDIDENCPASNLNNSQRALMAHLKNVSTGAVNLETPAVDQLNFGDNAKAIFGAGNDLQIYHDGSHSYIKDNGTGSLLIQGSTAVVIEDPSGNNMAFFEDGGEAILYHNASARLTTKAAGVDVTGTVTADGLTVVDTTGTNYSLIENRGAGAVKDTLVLRNFGSGSNTSGQGAKLIFAPTVNDVTTRHSAISGVQNGSNNIDIRFDTSAGGDPVERMRIGSDGRIYLNTTTNFVGQGNTSTGQMFQPEGTAYFSRASGYSLGLNRNGDGELTNFSRSGSFVGSINVTSSSTSYNTSSDHRLKENVADMTGAIARVKSLAPKRFNFIADDSVTVDGFLAHEAQAVVPEAITGTHNEVETWTQQEIDDGDAPDGTSVGDDKLDEDGNTIPVMQGIDQSKLVPLLTGALQEAIAKIETLETQRADLEARLTALEA